MSGSEERMVNGLEENTNAHKQERVALIQKIVCGDV